MKILIVKTSSLGDIIQSLPVLSFLQKECLHATIDWVVEKPFCELLESHPYVHQVIPVSFRTWKKRPFKCRSAIRKAFHVLRKKRYDVVFDLQGNIKSALITGAVRAKAKVGTTFRSAPEWPNSLVLNRRFPLNKKDPISLQYLSLIQNHFSVKPHPVATSLFFPITPEETVWVAENLHGTHRTMVCPGSHWENKKLSLPQWIEHLKTLEETHFYFVWGNEKEKQEALSLQAQFPKNSTVLPRMRLPLWQHFMTHMSAIYTVDSSALHLAATTSVPTYSFFGPSNASIYKPPLPHHHALQGPCPYGKTFTKRCPALRTCKTGACLKSLNISKKVY